MARTPSKIFDVPAPKKLKKLSLWELVDKNGNALDMRIPAKNSGDAAMTFILRQNWNVRKVENEETKEAKEAP